MPNQPLPRSCINGQVGVLGSEAGGILAVPKAAPQQCVQIHNFFDKEKIREPKALQNSLTPLAKAVTTRRSIGGLEMAIDLTGYPGGNPRSPLKKPGKEVEEDFPCLPTGGYRSVHSPAFSYSPQPHCSKMSFLTRPLKWGKESFM